MLSSQPTKQCSSALPNGPGRLDGVRVAVRNAVTIPLRRDSLTTFITFDGLAKSDHFAIRFGEIRNSVTPLVRMHSECVTGDVFGSLRCDCGAQLAEAVETLHARGGILLYLRQEGRGIGLAAKLDAYVLQDAGLDTYTANRALSLPADARDYACGAAMLRALGVPRIRLLSNNPDKAAQLTRCGIEIVERISTGTFATEFNRAYLSAKVHGTGHSLRI
jgi:GTP cyclohydrolase II